jgi:hypothetical protein
MKQTRGAIHDQPVEPCRTLKSLPDVSKLSDGEFLILEPQSLCRLTGDGLALECPRLAGIEQVGDLPCSWRQFAQKLQQLGNCVILKGNPGQVPFGACGTRHEGLRDTCWDGTEQNRDL